ncbi:hypothetical protein CUMW_021700 [Citrus unshiu]|nr:hypothetical protein CUMW_021700 [Citrus unshiu]
MRHPPKPATEPSSSTRKRILLRFHPVLVPLSAHVLRRERSVLTFSRNLPRFRVRYVELSRTKRRRVIVTALLLLIYGDGSGTKHTQSASAAEILAVPVNLEQEEFFDGTFKVTSLTNPTLDALKQQDGKCRTHIEIELGEKQKFSGLN